MGIVFCNVVMKKLFVIILLYIVGLFRLLAQDCVETLNGFSYIRINPACVHKESSIMIDQQDKDSSLKTTKISFYGDNYSYNMPINIADFPNVEEITLSGVSSIMSFNEIDVFGKLKNINIVFDPYPGSLISMPLYGFLDISKLYNVINLKQISIEPDPFLLKNLGFGFFINDTNFIQLSELQSVDFPSIYNPIWIFSKMPQLTKIYFRRMNDRVDYVDKIQSYILLNIKKEYYCSEYDKNALLENFKTIKKGKYIKYSGDFVVQYNDNKIACCGTLRDGLPIGRWVYYDNNSDASYEEYYDNGILNYIKNFDKDCSFPYINIEKKGNIEKHIREHRINGQIYEECFHKIVLDNGNVLIVWDRETMRRIQCIDVTNHIKYFIQEDMKNDSLIIAAGLENYSIYEVPYHLIYTIKKRKLSMEFEDTTRIFSIKERECLNLICDEHFRDSLKTIVNNEIQKFNNN